LIIDNDNSESSIDITIYFDSSVKKGISIRNRQVFFHKCGVHKDTSYENTNYKNMLIGY
jgi:hypothetical protein